MSMTLSPKQQAHASSVSAAYYEWQRRAITWAECCRRADVTASQQAELKKLGRYIDRTTMEREVARILAAN